MSEEKKGMLAAGAAYSIFGLSYLFSKMALDITEPMILLCVRFSVTFIILNLLVIFRVFKVNYRGKNIWAAVLVGIVQPVLYLCLLIAYLLGAYYSILIRKLSKQFTAFEITYVMFIIGFGFFTAGSVRSHLPHFEPARGSVPRQVLLS